MAKDLTLAVENGFLNVRVGAIIEKDGKFLFAGNGEFFYPVGGRVRFGETSEQALHRELIEELGCDMPVDRLGFVIENYFIGSYEGKKNVPVFEIGFYYYLKVPAEFNCDLDRVKDETSSEQLHWVEPSPQLKLFPECFRTALKEPCSHVRHVVITLNDSDSNNVLAEKKKGLTFAD